MATQIQITDDYFKYGNRKYFRGNAHLLQLASYGKKRGGALLSNSYVDPQGKVKRKYLDNKCVTKGISIKIDWSQTSKSSFEINGLLKYFGIDGKLNANGSHEKVKSAKLELINFFINEGELINLLNINADTTRKYLADEGKDGRTVTETFVIMAAELAEKFNNATSLSISATADDSGLKIIANGSKSGTTSITLSAGACFAYKLHKVTKWNDNKTKIENMEADYYGMS